ncbi:hypothetical protein LMG31886_21620 [Xanthomonas hydrangeae]|nr:hypothetical protein LMG31886_21620 [Xanthomonas hydrangeae]CAD7734911.1 hypothetical protein LMG31886_21620 [Xanthomonas hydrangeae]CAD7744885.1 hypothetical protein LMG31885_38610 [Xanthomonas hydrangeae]CAD7744888.1 hypothetical protein LMG31885_38610 [Xanthomonas hydrangeae]
MAGHSYDNWIAKLVDKVVLNDHSAAQYIFALKYWSAWHELRYGYSLPLAETPPAPVCKRVVTDFLCDHMITVSQGHLALHMAEPIRDELTKRGFNGRRTMVTPTTTEWRVNVLRSIQKACNFPFDKSCLAEHLDQLQASFRASQATLGHMPGLTVLLEYLLNRLLSVCTRDDEGSRDAALILLVSYLSPRQVACLRMGDLLPGRIAVQQDEVDAVDITPLTSETKYQRVRPLIRLLAGEAVAVKAWGAIREQQAAAPDASFFTRKTRVDYPACLNEAWITRRLRLIAGRAGLLGTHHGAMCTPKKLRLLREHEYFEQSMQARLGRAMRIGISSALRHLERASDPVANAAHRGD